MLDVLTCMCHGIRACMVRTGSYIVALMEEMFRHRFQNYSYRIYVDKCRMFLNVCVMVSRPAWYGLEVISLP